jgi:hypothetical protein
VAGNDTETRLPIGVAALPILAIERSADRGEYRQAAGAIAAGKHNMTDERQSWRLKHGLSFKLVQPIAHLKLEAFAAFFVASSAASADSVCASSLRVKPLSILTNTRRRLRVLRLPITVPYTPWQLMRWPSFMSPTLIRF